MVRGDHRGEITRLKKVDTFISRDINSQTRAFEGEALLEALQDIVNLIKKKLGAKFDFPIENQDNLATKSDQSTEFHTAV